MPREKTSRESSDPYYDLIDDYDLIVSSFQTQYGLRLSREISEMPWEEFKQLLSGISPETPLGRIVSIRSEDNKDILKHFTPEQRRIHSEWQKRIAKKQNPLDTEKILETMKNAFIAMAGGVHN